MMSTVYRSAYVHTPIRGEWHIADDALIAVDATGMIVSVLDRDEEKSDEDWNATLEQTKANAISYFELTGFLIPGFVDCHIHAPQYTYTGNGLDLPLMKWLERYTFPAEARMAEPARAEEVYGRVVRRTLACGTTTACYFGTIHVEATLQLVDACAAAGQRGLCGLVSMDVNSGDYSMGVEGCIESLERFLDQCEEKTKKSGGLVHPVVTPRFVPTCSLELLKRLGDIAQKRGVRVQSHIAESHDVVSLCRTLHPEGPNEGREALILDEAGLLTDMAVMAHGVSSRRLRLIQSD